MRLAGIKIIRPLNCIFAAILTLFAYYFTIGNFDTNSLALLAATGTFLITAAGNTLNDFFDYKIDLKNKPYRPLPSKLISRREAIVLSFLLFALGLTASYLVNPYVLMIAIVATFSLVAYSANSKYLGLSGNVLISFLTALVFISGSFVATTRLSSGIVIIAVSAFAINLSREVIKDIEDYEADKGLKLTLPQKVGKQKAALVASAFLILNLVIVYVILPLYVTGVVLLLSVPVVFLLSIRIDKILKNQKADTASHIQKILKLIMLLEFLFVVLDKFVINLKVY